MSWIQDNKVPAAILGVTGAGVIGLGVMLFNAWSAAAEAQETFDAVNASLANLNSAKIAPTPENLAAKHLMVKDYTDIANKMATVLYKLQPEPKPMTDTDFQAKVKARTLEVKKLGAGKLPAEFNLTFDQYVDNLPKANDKLKLTADQVATELSGYLDAVETVTTMLLQNGVSSIDMIERSELAAEKSGDKAASPNSQNQRGNEAASDQMITERRQLRLVLRLDQGVLQSILSKLASPSEMPYFTVVRLVRIENEVQVGPARVVLSASSTPGPGGEPGSDEASAPAAPTEAKPANKGEQPATRDSAVVLGNEGLRAYLEIDLVKFIDHSKTAAAAGSTR
ncbi:MAG: Amuc_1100 family pilus-like protein [Verrucomicrobia bacterium]|nr:Amuc_1100 family pilus-like protein [Verrucomicrobiota bacterium]